MIGRKVICLVGPTGSGKSALGLRLAQLLGGTIINADSRQVFRAFPLITAQPAADDLASCPHRLYGFLQTEESISAGTWAKRAFDEIKQASIPILIGGTGLYLRALFDGIVDIPELPESLMVHLTTRCLTSGPQALHQELAACDPDYAARIHPNDKQRIIRALAVFYGTGKTFSWWHAHTPPPPEMEVLRLGIHISLQDLTPRLISRIDQMLTEGALQEARKEYERCPMSNAPGWSGIGCRELYSYLAGQLSLEEARNVWIKNTRAYAKRQLTWFNADKRILWFSPASSDILLQSGEAFIRQRPSL